MEREVPWLVVAGYRVCRPRVAGRNHGTLGCLSNKENIPLLECHNRSGGGLFSSPGSLHGIPFGWLSSRGKSSTPVPEFPLDCAPFKTKGHPTLLLWLAAPCFSL